MVLSNQTTQVRNIRSRGESKADSKLDSNVALL